mgnify:CR=1 FL=1
MKVYQSKPRITLSPAIRDGQKYVEVEFDEDDAIRLSLSKEKGVWFEGDRAYLPEEGFDLSGFFDRHVETAYINYSALRNTLTQRKNGKTTPRHSRPAMPRRCGNCGTASIPSVRTLPISGSSSNTLREETFATSDRKKSTPTSYT